MTGIGLVFAAIGAGALWLFWQRGQIAKSTGNGFFLSPKRRARWERAERRRKEFGENPRTSGSAQRSRGLFEEIRIYYEETKEELRKEQVDEVTWRDLEMDEVFLRVNHTRSYIGEQVLYCRLHGTKEKKQDWERFESHVTHFTEHPGEREELEEALARIGKTKEDYYLPMFLKYADCLKIEHVWVYHVLQALLFGSFLAGVILGHPFWIAVFIGTVLTNVCVYTVSKEKYEAYLYALGSVKQLVTFGQLLVEREDWRKLFAEKELLAAVEDLEGLGSFIGTFQGKKAGSLTGDALDILRDYLIGATLWDITAFGRIVKLTSGKQKQLFLLYEATGQVDLEISVASFRRSLPGYCIPVIEERSSHGGTLRAEGLYHPLLEHPVCNDFFPEKNCMITGANASGKSTFIKAVAINAILAQTIHTAAAVYFAMPRMRVLTSMAVRDDILSGESYYMKEVRYLKRIVDAVDEEVGMPVLCVIDEILRGTNTAERIAASKAVCHYLGKRNCLAIVATHDMELAESLGGQYNCYYFESAIWDTDICFDYKIHEGIGKNRNAIQLLSYLEFPKEIVDMARQLA